MLHHPPIVLSTSASLLRGILLVCCTPLRLACLRSCLVWLSLSRARLHTVDTYTIYTYSLYNSTQSFSDSGLCSSPLSTSQAFRTHSVRKDLHQGRLRNGTQSRRVFSDNPGKKRAGDFLARPRGSRAICDPSTELARDVPWPARKPESVARITRSCYLGSRGSGVAAAVAAVSAKHGGCLCLAVCLPHENLLIPGGWKLWDKQGHLESGHHHIDDHARRLGDIITLCLPKRFFKSTR